MGREGLLLETRRGMKKAFTPAKWRMKASRFPTKDDSKGLASSFSLTEKWVRDGTRTSAGKPIS